ncbi:hypothetical protein TL16_g01344 [Triparma laevis f. inornata]|uniref:Uncharacterized protein n=2 Tax=Triparma laevis TaxID=1534972 RepID=A0A9W7C9I4_9STRA|nr:hypothetical protein TL16_g01344 [Triparma laevis f. inornata]GMI01665.1 hypothetical protein TrLO_g11113 [Triparma laevis f. longispina]
MIPDSLQTLGHHVFHSCSKLVLSDIIVNDKTIDTTSEVVVPLRMQQRIGELEIRLAEQATENVALNATIAEQATEIAALKKN